jgi:4,5-dihydroxyphthalate decarboxylase
VLHPSEMFWRQLHFAEFDISEMSLASLMIAVGRGDDRFVAIPVFTMRRVFHTAILVRRGAGIACPADLRGKRIGVPEYQQTSAIWSRGVLQREFGVHPSEIEWFMERGPERSHGGATGFSPPAGVRLHQIGGETDIGSMLLAGTLDATLLYLTDPNLVDRSRADLSKSADIVKLFPDARAESHRFYAGTGYLPINHTVVIRRRLLEANPWLALNLFTAFTQAKALADHDLLDGLEPYFATGALPLNAAEALRRDDPLAYGMAAARPVLRRLAEHVREQGLTGRIIDLDEIFAASTLST